MIIKRFPMPPTSNRLLMPVRGRLIKSNEARIYDKKVDFFRLRNHKILDEVENAFKDKLVMIDTIFVFHIKRLIGKQGQVKIIDATNRIKISHDNFARVCGLDDKNFIAGYFEKVYCDNESDEQVIFKIGEFKEIRNVKDLF